MQFKPNVIANQCARISDGVKQSKIASARSYPTQPRNDVKVKVVYNHQRLKASTLVEVLVALVIITLVMALAATLYAKMAYKRPDNTVNLQLRLKALAQETKRDNDFTAASYETADHLLIDRHVTPYNGDTLLLLLELSGQKTGTGETAIYREIIIKQDYDEH